MIGTKKATEVADPASEGEQRSKALAAGSIQMLVLLCKEEDVGILSTDIFSMSTAKILRKCKKMAHPLLFPCSAQNLTVSLPAPCLSALKAQEAHMGGQVLIVERLRLGTERKATIPVWLRTSLQATERLCAGSKEHRSMDSSRLTSGRVPLTFGLPLHQRALTQ
jgi:hypothetical protein